MSKKGTLSLAPLTFEQAVADILKIKPEPKIQQPKSKEARKKNGQKTSGASPKG